VEPFRPSDEQNMIKARLRDALETHSAVLDGSNLTLEQLCNLTGCGKIKTWAKAKPEIVAWLLDVDYTKHKVQAAAEAAIDKLIQILNSDTEAKTLTAKDQIKASETLLQLADRFPTKHKVIEWRDKDVGKMDADEVDKAIAAQLKRLGKKTEA
jgi:hypothetical protein